MRRGEPVWTDEDRAWAMALLEYEADLCSGCGQPRTESMDPAHEDHYRTGAKRCHSCKAIANESERWSSPKDAKGLMISVQLEGGAG